LRYVLDTKDELDTSAARGRAAAVLLVGACSSGGGQGAGTSEGGGGRTGAQPAASGDAAQPVTTTAQDWKGVADALGREGKVMGGAVYRVGFPRGDLKVTSQGVQVKPGLSFGSYAAFARYGDGSTTAMGDLVVTEDELPKVTDALQQAGIAQTAVHKHLLAQDPPVWWTHFQAAGKNPDQIAQGIRAALNVTATPPPAGSPAGGHDRPGHRRHRHGHGHQGHQ